MSSPLIPSLDGGIAVSASFFQSLFHQSPGGGISGWETLFIPVQNHQLSENHPGRSTVKMPDILIVNDNASFTSSDTFSTRDSTEQPRVQLRRRSTVVQLTRKVSKRLSQSILRSGAQDHELSEKNLRDLDGASYRHPQSPRSPNRQVHERKLHSPIYEDTEECPPVDVEAVREMRLHESYAVFCQNFTLSGSNRMSRRFDLTMGMENPEHCQPSPTHQTPEQNDTFELLGSRASPDHITVDARPRPNAVALPISCASTSTMLDSTPTSQLLTTEKSPQELSDPDMPTMEGNFDKSTSSLEMAGNRNHLQPPPRIITPTVWMDMQREDQERKAARRERFLNPFRSWFMTSQPSWGRRYDIVE